MRFWPLRGLKTPSLLFGVIVEGYELNASGDRRDGGQICVGSHCLARAFGPPRHGRRLTTSFAYLREEDQKNKIEGC
jgi:hypothetical protein